MTKSSAHPLSPSPTRRPPPSMCCVPQVIAHELEFISKQAKGQQAKGRARQRRYEELVDAANSYVKNTQVGRWGSIGAAAWPGGPGRGVARHAAGHCACAGICGLYACRLRPAGLKQDSRIVEPRLHIEQCILPLVLVMCV